MKSTAAHALAAFCIVTLCRMAAPLAAVHFDGPGSTSLNLGFLVQPQLDISVEPAGTENRDARFDPFLRRTRIYAFGQVTPSVAFFFQTDVPNAGLLGDWRPRLQMQDAFVEFDVHPAFVLDAGLVYVPFSHAGMQAAHNLLGVDYPSFAVQGPTLVMGAAGAQFPSNFNGRDFGLMARGMLLDGHLEYRVALTQGVSKFLGNTPLNPHAWPRATGRLTYNFFEAEGSSDISGYFYGGSYLEDREDGALISPKRIVSVGGSATYQRQAISSLDPASTGSDYKGYDVDLFVDLPMMDGTQALNGQVNFYYYDQATVFGPSLAVFSEAGYRFGRIEPTLGWEYLHYNDSNVGGDVNYWHVGANYWLAGHVANVKLDAGARTINARTNQVAFAARLETQVAF